MIFQSLPKYKHIGFPKVRIVERRKLNGENILFVGELQPAGIIQTALQYRIFTRSHIFIRYQQLGEYQRRNIRTFPERVRFEKEDAISFHT